VNVPQWVQATLADSFLDDLDELDDEFSDSGTSQEEDADVPDADVAVLGGTVIAGEDDEEETNLDDMLGTLADGTGVRSVTRLRSSAKFQHHMAAVEAALKSPRTGKTELLIICMKLQRLDALSRQTMSSALWKTIQSTA
jgi:hypothetical protein